MYLCAHTAKSWRKWTHPAEVWVCWPGRGVDRDSRSSRLGALELPRARSRTGEPSGLDSAQVATSLSDPRMIETRGPIPILAAAVRGLGLRVPAIERSHSHRLHPGANPALRHRANAVQST